MNQDFTLFYDDIIKYINNGQIRYFTQRFCVIFSILYRINVQLV